MSFLQLPNSSFSSILPTLQLAVDSTSIGEFKTCPRKYYYSIILGFTPNSMSVDLLFGLLYHSALEFYDHQKTSGADHEEALRLTVKKVLELTWDKNLKRPIQMGFEEKNRASLLRTVIWYLDQFSADPLETLILASGKPAVELSFRVELEYKSSTNENYLLCGHMDRIALLNSYPYVLDRKTTKHTLDAQYFAQYSPHNQFSTYVFAGKIIYSAEIKGIICDAAQVAMTFSRFMRKDISRIPPILSEWHKDLSYYLQAMDRCAQENYWPMNDKACFRCSFRDICAMPESLRPAYLTGSFSRRTWDPLQVRGDI